MDPANGKAARGTTAIAVTAAFVVLRYEAAEAEKVVALLTDLFDAESRPRRAWRLPTYAEAVRAVTERALSREAVETVLPAIGAVRFVPVCERLALASVEELNALMAAIR